MTTTFQSRELVRDQLVSLFTANNSWQEVYGYMPSVEELLGKTPFLIIRSKGTSQEMSGVETNKASYRFILSSWVLAGGKNDASVTSSAAEDDLDTLDKVLRQVIRDNTGTITYGNIIRFESGYSEVSDVIVQGLSYITESRFILVDLPRGAK